MQVKRGGSRLQLLYEENAKMRTDLASMDSLLTRYRAEAAKLQTAEQEAHNFERQISMLQDQKAPCAASLTTRSLLEVRQTPRTVDQLHYLAPGAADIARLQDARY